MAPLEPRTKNVITLLTTASAGPADSTPPRFVHVPVNAGSPEGGSVVVTYHSALSVPRQATVRIDPVMTAAGAPMHRAAPTGCQSTVTDRIHSPWSVPVAMNSGWLAASAFVGAATAGGAVITPPSGCHPEPNCGACAHNCPSVPSAPMASVGAGDALTCAADSTPSEVAGPAIAVRARTTPVASATDPAHAITDRFTRRLPRRTRRPTIPALAGSRQWPSRAMTGAGKHSHGLQYQSS